MRGTLSPALTEAALAMRFRHSALFSCSSLILFVLSLLFVFLLLSNIQLALRGKQLAFRLSAFCWEDVDCRSLLSRPLFRFRENRRVVELPVSSTSHNVSINFLHSDRNFGPAFAELVDSVAEMAAAAPPNIQIRLVVTDFGSAESPTVEEVLSQSGLSYSLSVVRNMRFSRSTGLQIALEQVADADDICFTVDSRMRFPRDFAVRIVRHTVRGLSVFAPNPILLVSSSSSSSSASPSDLQRKSGGSPDGAKEEEEEEAGGRQEERESASSLSGELWSRDSFHAVGFFKSDAMRVGGICSNTVEGTSAADRDDDEDFVFRLLESGFVVERFHEYDFLRSPEVCEDGDVQRERCPDQLKYRGNPYAEILHRREGRKLNTLLR